MGIEKWKQQHTQNGNRDKGAFGGYVFKKANRRLYAVYGVYDNAQNPARAHNLQNGIVAQVRKYSVSRILPVLEFNKEARSEHRRRFKIIQRFLPNRPPSAAVKRSVDYYVSHYFFYKRVNMLAENAGKNYPRNRRRAYNY